LGRQVAAVDGKDLQTVRATAPLRLNDLDVLAWLSAGLRLGWTAAIMTDNDVMSVSDSICPPIRDLWHQAVEHAGVTEDGLHLLAGVGDPSSDREPSVHLQPGEELAYDSWGHMFNQASLDEANHPTNLHRHRIGLRCNFPYDSPLGAAVALGLLRHEIEHAIQYSGPDAEQLYALDCIADDVALAKERPEGTTYYRLKPTELGANAAAASLVLGNVTAEVAAQLRAGKFAPFVTPQTAIPVADLPRLTVQFIYEHGSWEALVEDAYPGARGWWRELVVRGS
jgi:hypothetical protein